MVFEFLINRSMKMVLILTAFFLCQASFAGENNVEKALVFSLKNEELEWGPCPDIFPDSCEIAVLHGSPEDKNTDIFFKIPPGAELVKHRHTSAERMVLVSGKLQVKYDGQDKEILKPGFYGYGPPELPHTAACLEGENPCVLFIAFNQPIDVFPVETSNTK